MDVSVMLGVPATPVLTVDEAARVLRVGRSLAYQLAREYDATGGCLGVAGDPGQWLFAGPAVGAARVGVHGSGRTVVRAIFDASIVTDLSQVPVEFLARVRTRVDKIIAETESTDPA